MRHHRTFTKVLMPMIYPAEFWLTLRELRFSTYANARKVRFEKLSGDLVKYGKTARRTIHISEPSYCQYRVPVIWAGECDAIPRQFVSLTQPYKRLCASLSCFICCLLPLVAVNTRLCCRDTSTPKPSTFHKFAMPLDIYKDGLDYDC